MRPTLVRDAAPYDADPSTRLVRDVTYSGAMLEVGRICEIVRYPVKSMAGTALESAALGWYGLDGDRRFAFQRLGDVGGMPWLTAGRLPELLLYHPGGFDERAGEPLVTHVRTPSGSLLELGSEELKAELTERFKGEVELMKLNHGIFDEGAVSVISLATIGGIGREAGWNWIAGASGRTRPGDEGGEPFLEDAGSVGN